MKKFLATFLVLACSLPILLAACGDKTNKNPDGSSFNVLDHEVGDYLPVYPNCSFNCVLSIEEKEYTVHIDSFTAKLVEKNVINEGDTIRYYEPGVIELSVTGSTSEPILVSDTNDKSLYCDVAISTTPVTFRIPLTIHDNNTISGTRLYTVYKVDYIYLEGIYYY